MFPPQNGLFIHQNCFFPVDRIFSARLGPLTPEIGHFELGRMWTSPGPKEVYCEDSMLGFDLRCPCGCQNIERVECQAPWGEGSWVVAGLSLVWPDVC